MRQPRVYKTKQRELVSECLSENRDKHLTAENILEFLREKNASIGKATVYRTLDKLAEEGKVRKYAAEEGTSACYQYTGDGCSEHFHLKCVKCNRLFHVECEYMTNLSDHVFQEHKFSIDSSKTIFYGICEECTNA